MEDEFKKALKDVRLSSKKVKTRFSQALFETALFNQTLGPAEVVKSEVKPEVENNLSERLKTLDELTNFTSGEFSKKPHAKSINIQGGAQIVKKEHSGSISDAQTRSLSSIKDFNLSQGYESLNNKYAHLKGEDPIDVIFICDSAINLNQDIEDALELFYEKNVCMLFSRMISAMKLSESRYMLSSLKVELNSQELDYKDMVLSEIALFKPRIIITLGGAVSMKLLDTKSRLQSIHGQFFDFHLQDENKNKFSTKLMPLFSPSYINEAPNTKRIAWEDMQKVMRELAIIS